MELYKCHLCNLRENSFYSRDKKREYFRCNNCKTIFVPPKYHLALNEEKERYSKHTNSNTEPGYINFLKRITVPVTKNIKKGSTGLDFGCGPGPILKNIFNSMGYTIEEYDLYFKKDDSMLLKKWDFIITTEVVEHLKEPFNVINSLWDLIKPGGILAIMTNLYREDIDFKSWYYKGDPTHIQFFCKESFLWLKDKISANVEFIDKDIIILKKDYYINN